MTLDNIKEFIIPLVPTLLAIWHWVNRDLALAISIVDKNGDGLSNEEKEELAVKLIRDSKFSLFAFFSDDLIRIIVRRLCHIRKKNIKTDFN
jgi:hypothetical protein